MSFRNDNNLTMELLFSNVVLKINLVFKKYYFITILLKIKESIVIIVLR